MPALPWVVKEVDVAPSIAYSTRSLRMRQPPWPAAQQRKWRHGPGPPLSDFQRALDDLRLPGGPVKVLLDPSS